jgi:excisionase family DNA binding protein
MTTYAQKHTKIAEMFTRGHKMEEILVAGLTAGWSRNDVERVVAEKDWVLTPAGRLHSTFIERKKPTPTPTTLKASLRKLSNKPEPQPKKRRHLTADEIADDLGVSKMSIYRLLETGELGNFRVGRSYRVPLEAYQRYLDRAYTETAS